MKTVSWINKMLMYVFFIDDYRTMGTFSEVQVGVGGLWTHDLSRIQAAALIGSLFILSFADGQ